MEREALNALSNKVIGAAIEVHKELGPGLLESTYEACLCHELSLQGIACRRQLVLPITYKGLQVEEGYRIDVLVEDELILELKAVEEVTELHKAQLLTYLRLSKCWLGLLLNFNVPKMRDGIVRLVC
ncbi:MAG: GxxExxY protein [Candidatus Hydrogenedentota bacterium]|jgi:GxxExxY protein